MNDRPLNHNQLRFVDALLATETLNATAAYESVYKARGDAAGVNAAKLMADPRIQAEIERRQAARLERMEMTQDDVARHLQELAEADPRDLVEYYRGACRHCHGYDFKYQRTPAEFDRDLVQHITQRSYNKELGPDPLGLEFDVKGGVGFNQRKDPNKNCPECFGVGVGYSFIKDTRTLSKAAARLYAGVKETRNGLEVLTRSQDKALELMGRHHGMFKDNVALTGKGGLPLIPPRFSIDWGDPGADDEAE